MATTKVVDKFEDVTKFIKENMKLISEKDGQKYQVNQEHFTNFLNSKGIPTEVVKQLANAQSEFNNGAVAVCSELLIDDPKVDRVQINTRTQNGVVSARVTRKIDTRTPVTGEPFTKFGVVTMKVNLKSRIDKDLLLELAAEIEAASK
jgi:hypothetical protein